MDIRKCNKCGSEMATYDDAPASLYRDGDTLVQVEAQLVRYYERDGEIYRLAPTRRDGTMHMCPACYAETATYLGVTVNTGA